MKLRQIFSQVIFEILSFPNTIYKGHRRYITMGKKARIKRYPQKFGRKYSNHPAAEGPGPVEAAKEVVEAVVEAVARPVAAVAEAVVDAVEEVVKAAPKAKDPAPAKKTTRKSVKPASKKDSDG